MFVRLIKRINPNIVFPSELSFLSALSQTKFKFELLISLTTGASLQEHMQLYTSYHVIYLFSKTGQVNVILFCIFEKLTPKGIVYEKTHMETNANVNPLC